MSPNILLIITDQHRWDCMGCTGNPDIRTPHLDALAADGVVHENAFCPHPACAPSRYSLLSGLDVRQHLACSNHSTLPSGLATFPRVLRENGYSTHAIGGLSENDFICAAKVDRLFD